MLAGAILYGITHGVPPLDAARAANFLAMHVITQVGVDCIKARADFGTTFCPTSDAMPNRLRTFIAVDIEQFTRDRLVGLQERLAAGGAAAKWVERSQSASHAVVLRRSRFARSAGCVPGGFGGDG